MNPERDLIRKKALLQAIINCYRNHPELGNRVSRRLSRLHRQTEGTDRKNRRDVTPKPKRRKKRLPPVKKEKPILNDPIPVVDEPVVQQFSVEEFFNAVNHAEGEMQSRHAPAQTDQFVQDQLLEEEVVEKD